MISLLGRNSRRPDVTFHASGRIDITAHVARILGLTAGDVIDVGYQNGEFLLYVAHRANTIIGRHEAQCWPTKQGSRNFRAHSKRLCHNVMHLSRTTDCLRVPMGSQVTLAGGTPAVILIVLHNLSSQQ